MTFERRPQIPGDLHPGNELFLYGFDSFNQLQNPIAFLRKFSY